MEQSGSLGWLGAALQHHELAVGEPGGIGELFAGASAMEKLLGGAVGSGVPEFVTVGGEEEDARTIGGDRGGLRVGAEEA